MNGINEKSGDMMAPLFFFLHERRYSQSSSQPVLSRLFKEQVAVDIVHEHDSEQSGHEGIKK